VVDLVMTCWCKKHRSYVLCVCRRRRKVRGGVLWYATLCMVQVQVELTSGEVE